MVKNFNELKDIAKKLMLENNYDIKEEELIYVTTTDITDYYEKIASRDKTVLSEVYGTDELPLIHNYITRAEASTKKLEMDENDYKKNLLSGVKAYYVDDKVIQLFINVKKNLLKALTSSLTMLKCFQSSTRNRYVNSYYAVNRVQVKLLFVMM